MDVVIQLLKEAVDKSYAEHPEKIILLDGFPREIEQAVKFEEKVGHSNTCGTFLINDKTSITNCRPCIYQQ